MLTTATAQFLAVVVAIDTHVLGARYCGRAIVPEHAFAVVRLTRRRSRLTRVLVIGVDKASRFTLCGLLTTLGASEPEDLT
jgi:hypothetical protein